MNKDERIVILGAGIAGLTTAWKLLGENPSLQVTLIERDSLPGGLAKSLHWNGYVLDLGPHRFHTEIAEVKQFIHAFCEERMIRVKRASRMYLNGRYIPYPIRPVPTLQALGIWNTLAFTLSALRVLFRQSAPAVSYEDYVKGYYGEKLYERIFKPFAEKVWGLEASRIAAETAKVRLRGETIWHALKDGFFSKEETYVAQFLYPPNGIGEIPQKFAQEVIRMGGDILLQNEVTDIHTDEGQVVAVEINGPRGRQVLPCDILVNTIPLRSFIPLVHPAAPDECRNAACQLNYRALVLLYLQYEEEINIEDTWLYYPEEHVPFSRIYVPDNFAPHKKQPGKTVLCVEFPCSVDSPVWNAEAKELARQADDVLGASGLVRNRSRNTLAMKIKEGYPLYCVGYEPSLQTVLGFLKGWGNCLSIGRQGLFRHNNLDQSIQMGLHAAAEILQGHSCETWYDTIDRYNDYRIVD